MKRLIYGATILSVGAITLVLAAPRISQRLAAIEVNQRIRYEECISMVRPPSAGTNRKKVAGEIADRIKTYYRDAERLRAQEQLRLGNGLSATIDFDWRPNAYDAVAWSGGRKILSIHFADGQATEHNHTAGVTNKYRCEELDGPSNMICTQGLRDFGCYLGTMNGTYVGKKSGWVRRYVEKALGSKYLGQVVVNDEKLDVLEYVQWTKKEHYIGTFGTDEFPGLEQVDYATIFLYYVANSGRVATCHRWSHQNGRTSLEFSYSYREILRSPPIVQ